MMVSSMVAGKKGRSFYRYFHITNRLVIWIGVPPNVGIIQQDYSIINKTNFTRFPIINEQPTHIRTIQYEF